LAFYQSYRRLVGGRVIITKCRPNRHSSRRNEIGNFHLNHRLAGAIGRVSQRGLNPYARFLSANVNRSGTSRRLTKINVDRALDLVHAEALEVLLPLGFAFLVIPMLGLPRPVLEVFERVTLVLVIIAVGIDTLRTLRLVEAKFVRRVRLKAGCRRQIRAAETQYSVMHRLLNVLVILATLGAALMVFDQVRAFGASIITSAGILGLVAGIAAQRTLQNVFAGLQLAITEPIALGDVIEVENAVGTIEEINLSFVSVRLRDLRRLILPVTYFLEKPFTNWTRTSSESLISFSLVLSLDASLAAIRKQVETILHANTLWTQWQVGSRN
jgi:hypothetical protein